MTDLPIHTCVEDGPFTDAADIYRKTSLYGSEHVCSIIVRSAGRSEHRALHLATMLCEALEAAREAEIEEGA